MLRFFGTSIWPLHRCQIHILLIFVRASKPNQPRKQIDTVISIHTRAHIGTKHVPRPALWQWLRSACYCRQPTEGFPVQTAQMLRWQNCYRQTHTNTHTCDTEGSEWARWGAQERIFWLSIREGVVLLLCGDTVRPPHWCAHMRLGAHTVMYIDMQIHKLPKVIAGWDCLRGQ